MRRLIVAALTVMPIAAAAQDAPKLSERKADEIVVENVYRFAVAHYQPVYPLPVIATEAEARYDTPEHALQSHFSAMFNGNYEWFERSWEPKSRAENKASDDASGHGASYWLPVWAKVLTGKHVQLANRIETGNYVLIEYQLVGADGAVTFEDTMALETSEQRWGVTQALSDDPVLSFWKVTEHRLKKTVR